MLQLLEEFEWKSHDLLGKMERLGELLNCPDMPDDINGAKVQICLK